MNQMDIDMSLLDNNNKFNGNSNSRTVRDAIRERHTTRLKSSFNGNSDLSMAHMLDDNFSNIVSETPILTRNNLPLFSIPRVVTPQYVAPIIPRTMSASAQITPKIATLDTSVKPITVQEVKTALAATTNEASTSSSTSNSSTAPVVMSGGGSGGGGAAPAPAQEENAEIPASSARVAEEKKYLGLTKKQGLIALGVIAVGTLAYFKFVKKAF